MRSCSGTLSKRARPMSTRHSNETVILSSDGEIHFSWMVYPSPLLRTRFTVSRSPLSSPSVSLHYRQASGEWRTPIAVRFPRRSPIYDRLSVPPSSFRLPHILLLACLSLSSGRRPASAAGGRRTKVAEDDRGSRRRLRRARRPPAPRARSTSSSTDSSPAPSSATCACHCRALLRQTAAGDGWQERRREGGGRRGGRRPVVIL